MKKLFKKADEMEMATNMKAIKFAYLFLTFSLFTYIIIEFIKNGSYPATLMAILCTSGAIFFCTKLYETERLSKMDDNDEE